MYGSAPSDTDISQAQTISQKIYSILKGLGQQSFAFSKASYYDPLYLLGSSSNIVRVDVYLFAQGSSSTDRLDLAYHKLTLTIDANGLLNNSQSVIDDIKQQTRAEPLLKGKQVGLAIVYGGAPDVSHVTQAVQISSKIYIILADLGKQGPVFAKSAFYDPLFLLGDDANTVTVDVFLYQ